MFGRVGRTSFEEPQNSSLPHFPTPAGTISRYFNSAEQLITVMFGRGTISPYFNSAEKLITIMFGREGGQSLCVVAPQTKPPPAAPHSCCSPLLLLPTLAAPHSCCSPLLLLPTLAAPHSCRSPLPLLPFPLLPNPTVPGFQGTISRYFNSAEKLITIMFGRVGHAFNALNYTVQVSPVSSWYRTAPYWTPHCAGHAEKLIAIMFVRVGHAFNALNYTVQVSPASEGTDKCYNGPKQLPEINACCDPLPVTPDCPIPKLNVSMHPQTLPFIGRTIADPSCPTAQSRASAADSSSMGSPPSPPPPKSAERTSLVSGVVGFSLYPLAAAASFLLVM
ncbi:unnamed protein product [Closterium sp. Naga37s-1]|nr:unnamed protein product [Closterium sp. Naga37s-1]